MKAYLVILVIALSGCAALTDFALDKVTGGSDGGINTELVVGDKEQVVGSNIEVDAKNVGKVVGNSDNSTDAKGAEFVEVNNYEYPSWVVPILSILVLLFWALPEPDKMWLAFKNRKRKDD